MRRRTFFEFSAALLAQTPVTHAAAGPPIVDFSGDGIPLDAVAYAELLTRLAAEKKAAVDFYGRGETVAALERHMASLLGKERALFFPTGTMANRVALQTLAGPRRRVLVGRESHTYNDEGDGPQRLSGLSLIPLASGQATFTVEDIEAELRRFEGGPPDKPLVGAVALECPVRRKSGQVFDYEQMERVSRYARERGMGLHLDGARLLLASAYTKISPAQYSALVDTVYVSLYKYLNATGGAILAGPKHLIEQAVELRQSSGGTIRMAWSQASVALHYLIGFAERFQQVITHAETLFSLLEQDGRLRVEQVRAGTNVVSLHVDTTDREAWRKRLTNAAIMLRPLAQSAPVQLNINETILRRSPVDIARAFRKALD